MMHEEDYAGVNDDGTQVVNLEQIRVNRSRREIANLNERRRMQSINQGFQAVRGLLPDQEKNMSKAAILQAAVDYIYNLQQENTNLVAQLNQIQQNFKHQEEKMCESKQECERFQTNIRNTKELLRRAQFSGDFTLDSTFVEDVTRVLDASSEVDMKPPPLSPCRVKREEPGDLELEPPTIQPVMEKEKDCIYITSKSRNNLEVIIQAIRHLDGDVLFEALTGEEGRKGVIAQNGMGQQGPAPKDKRRKRKAIVVP